MSNINKLTKLKELLDKGVITQEEFDVQKSQLLYSDIKRKNILKNIGVGIGVFFVVIICLSIISSNFSQTNKTDVEKTVVEEKVKNEVPVEFSGECPVEASGSIYDNIIGIPELSCSIKNNTNKEISAVKLYFSPKDVYGEELSGIFSTNYLFTDDPISANGSTKRSWQMLDDEIRSGDVYIYSVYFADGTEWGSKDATVNNLKKYGYKIEVSY